MKKKFLFLFTLVSLFVVPKLDACTRVVYTGDNNIVLTGRSMDWKTPMESNLWAFPRGMERNGEVSGNSLKWTSKYGSVITSAFEICSTDGINEKGLVANILWLVESQYPVRDKNKPGITIAAWVQYVLDNYATVDEVVKALEADSFQIVTTQVPGEDRLATLHLSVSDSTGDSAIFEYLNGKLTVHHSKDYKVLTNSPVYDQQLAIASYWKQVGGLDFLPGTNRASDRFARADFYVNVLPKTNDNKLAIASVFSVVRNASVPYGISTPDKPEIATTQWRTLSDSKNKIYFFEETLTPNTFWVDLNKLDLSKGAPALKLELASGQTYTGEVSANFKKAMPFEFLPIMD